jgi:hypothetical protein
MSEASEVTVKYPGCVVQLTGTDGHAVLVFRRVRRELINYLVDTEGMPRAEATAKGEEFQAEATSGDYDNVLMTCHRWVTVT